MISGISLAIYSVVSIRLSSDNRMGTNEWGQTNTLVRHVCATCTKSVRAAFPRSVPGRLCVRQAFQPDMQRQDNETVVCNRENTGRQGRQPNASYRSVGLANFAKNLTIFRVSSTETPVADQVLENGRNRRAKVPSS